MEELQHSRLDVEYKEDSLSVLRSISGEHGLNRKRVYGLALDFAAANEESFENYAEEHGDN
ncbi:hypothetical protein NP511_17965 [Natrinema thermotolerans]|uniref:Uncharacterized protein n=1 Tax=Natrinema thermotolerans TaxID=121872 RepID=A0AAF0T1J4_9EURY|nr:hypothetical protein [Natrinema thermotolerans]QCC60243.1 hypothetical protein DVR14_17035 [Natrinema thermotolerans]QCC61155.1 hypothetical protein DVR14_21165 [Natrinema thermotolerans]WMT07262.1 hypothetical protein NP511_17965 [Natrinema thermotolerans]